MSAFSPSQSRVLTHCQAYKQVLSNVKANPIFVPQCVNSSACFPYITENDVQLVMQNVLQGAPDFPVILEGIYGAINNDSSFFIDGPVSLVEVTALPLLCNDYGRDISIPTSRCFWADRFQSMIDHGRLFKRLCKRAWTYWYPWEGFVDKSWHGIEWYHGNREDTDVAYSGTMSFYYDIWVFNDLETALLFIMAISRGTFKTSARWQENALRHSRFRS